MNEILIRTEVAVPLVLKITSGMGQQRGQIERSLGEARWHDLCEDPKDIWKMPRHFLDPYLP